MLPVDGLSMQRRSEPYTESVADSSNSGDARKWIVGVVMAIPLAVFGSYCVVAAACPVPFRSSFSLDPIYYSGSAAVALGLVVLAGAAILHFHWFWGQSDRYPGVGYIGSMISLLVMVGALSWFIYVVVYRA